jgi:hypothetical protein
MTDSGKKLAKHSVPKEAVYNKQLPRLWNCGLGKPKFEKGLLL